MSNVLNREAILGADDLRAETVEVPEWEGEVIVRSLTGVERDRFESESVEKKGDDYETNFVNLRARLVAYSVVDKDGERVFSDDDVEALGAKNASALNRVFEVARRLSGLTREDVEELAKNLEPSPSDGSSSD